MKRTAILCVLTVCLVALLAAVASAKKVERQAVQYTSLPRPTAPLPPDLAGKYGDALRSAASADTFVLHEEDFDGPGGPDFGGYTSVDRNDQVYVYFHVADGTELDGGTYGNLLPISDLQSMWCGTYATTAAPYCGYATLPGYGNDWDQILECNSLVGDSLSIQYTVFWDSEGNYDGTTVEYTFDDGLTWSRFPITDTLSIRTGIYENTAPAGGITETFAVGSAGASNVQVRFRFQSDFAWSDQDGSWPTDGAVMVDDITINTWSSGALVFTDSENFEAASPGSNTAGIWTGKKPPTFGDYADLYPGVAVVQEDPCFLNMSFFWGFFDDPLVTSYDCHTPNPLPGQGAIPFGNAEGVYMENEIWSPVFANTGSGLEYRLIFRAYRDLPLDNLMFYVWSIRPWSDPDGAGPAGLCPDTWRDLWYVYYGAQRDWHRAAIQVGSVMDAGADGMQVALGAIDMCGVWCGIYGSGACHSHSPLIDDVRVERIGVFSPQFIVRSTSGLFQDNFAEVLDQPETAAGRARADGPGINDETGEVSDAPWLQITALGGDPNTGVGPAAYCYVAVNPPQPAKSGAALGSDEQRPRIAGNRWPFITNVMISGVDWAVFRMDSFVTDAGVASPGLYLIDLNDNLFEPGDTVHYFYGADADGTPSSGNETYWHRTVNGQGVANMTSDINEAASNPCEFTILPAGGVSRGGDILYVDDTDDRGGPGQLFFDSAFDMLGIGEKVDRYDVLAPSSVINNSLSSRVKDNINQIINNYRTIIWDSGYLSIGTVLEDDWALLFQFLNTSDKGPGLYLSGDGIAEEWDNLTGPNAVQTRSVFMNFNLLDGDHIHHGEPVAPTLTATGPSFVHTVPDELVAYGGCALINDFDVLDPTGTAITEFPYPNSGDGAVISQQTINAAAQTATVILSGFSYQFIREASVGFPPARAQHLRNILIKFGTIVPEAVGIESGPEYANSLSNNYPNPFNPVTTIKYGIKESAHVSLKVYNAAGQLVRTLIDEVQAPDAVKPVEWDGSNNVGQSVSSGVYFYRLVTKDFSQTKKMVLLK